MGRKWSNKHDAKLFRAFLAYHQTPRVNYAAIARFMGSGYTESAVEHRFRTLRAKAQSEIFISQMDHNSGNAPASTPAPAPIPETPEATPRKRKRESVNKKNTNENTNCNAEQQSEAPAADTSSESAPSSSASTPAPSPAAKKIKLEPVEEVEEE
ncbi:hypothetical protein VTN96DRAFT_9077 [Rasamsonia emersonii]